MRTLLIDIETCPIRADVWGTRNVFVSVDQIREAPRMLAFAAKWYKEPKFFYYSEHKHSHDQMIDGAHSLLDQADAVVYYNGDRFDKPWMNTEFYLARKTPPAPYQPIDLWKTIAKQFRLPSTKLTYALRASGLVDKMPTGGHQLWVDCMNGDPKAWAKMRRYNINDVRVMEPLYERLLPWISGHPNHSVYSGAHCCTRCGGTDLQKRGFHYTLQSKYQRYQCNTCGGWSSDTRRVSGTDLKGVTA